MKPYFHQYLCYLIQAGRSIFNVKPLLVTINTGCLQIMCVHFIVSLFNAFFAVLMKKFIITNFCYFNDLVNQIEMNNFSCAKNTYSPESGFS